ncbi:MAG TPA: hypothetical protein VMT73_14070 [Anaerolineales bacterium]|nr:hypothetical protein [Anaerolineales bacterium]
MKKTIIPVLLVLVLLLSACSTVSNSKSSITGNSLSDSTKLILGILKLEDTDQAVTKEQATKLLPRWQLYQQLSISGTAAQEEYDAVLSDIKTAMTSAQLSTIDEMNLTQQDVTAVVSKQNVSQMSTSSSQQSSASGTRSSSNSSSKSSTSSSRSSSSGTAGGPPGGNIADMPMGGGDMPIDMGGGPVTTSSSSSFNQSTTTKTSTTTTTKITDMTTTILLNALIKLLESKIA